MPSTWAQGEKKVEKTHLVVGAGEVGTAVHAVLSCTHDTAIRDVQAVELDADVLHVCFPWSDNFVRQVEGYIAEHSVDLVVVHSTVAPGTCDANGWVHSPIRGRHPHLAESVFRFTKHFGGERAQEAADFFRAAGVPTSVHARAADCEAGKVWELIQYGVQIQVEKQIHSWCAEYGYDFDVVYTQMAESYNHGYSVMGYPQFVRPVLEHVPGVIGGHCVTQNAELIDHPLARMVTDEGAV